MSILPILLGIASVPALALLAIFCVFFQMGLAYEQTEQEIGRDG